MRTVSGSLAIGADTANAASICGIFDILPVNTKFLGSSLKVKRKELWGYLNLGLPPALTIINSLEG
jgi:hypothetical protein